MTREPVRWGVLGCAGIAVSKGLPGIAKAQGAVLQAVASRSLEKAQRVAEQFGAASAYGSYEALLEDHEIEAVYIPLPNSLHKPWSLAALRAGKHVLCEKPIALNADEAQEMQAAARQAGCFLLEAFMYRFTPLIQKALALTRAGVVGEVRAVHSVFNYRLGGDPTNIRLQPELGGGALYDVGSYCLNVERLLVGREPCSVWARLNRQPGIDVDLGGVGSLDFGNGVLGTFCAGMNARWDSYLRVSGTAGMLEAPSGFLGLEQRPLLRLAAERPPEGLELKESAVGEAGRSWEVPIEVIDPYVLQAEDLGAAIRGERPPQFGAEPLDANMRAIDACFQSDRTGQVVAL